MKIDFSDCVSKARKGDATAFANLYSLVYKDLYYIALCNLKNSFDAADAVSDAVLDAFISIKKLRDEKAFKSWIVKILIMKIKKKHTENINNKNNLTELSDDIDYVSSPLIEDYHNIEILQHIEMLSYNEKLVFSLSIICGYSSDEISEMIGMNSATVRSHLLRGREKLKRTLVV